MFCKNCGAEINSGEMFCRSCGAKVEENLLKVTSHEENLKEPKSSNELNSSNLSSAKKLFNSKKTTSSKYETLLNVWSYLVLAITIIFCILLVVEGSYDINAAVIFLLLCFLIIGFSLFFVLKGIAKINAKLDNLLKKEN